MSNEIATGISGIPNAPTIPKIMTTNHKPSEQAVKAAMKVDELVAEYHIRDDWPNGEGPTLTAARIIESEMGDVVELRDAADNAIPRLIELTRAYREVYGTAHTQDFDEAIAKLKKALRLGEGNSARNEDVK